MTNKLKTITPAEHLEDIIVCATELKYQIGRGFKQGLSAEEVIRLMELYNNVILEMEDLHNRLYEIESKEG